MFDKALALAELEQFAILMQHHLRQMQLAGDRDTAKEFATRLGKLKSDADYGVRQMKRALDTVCK